MGVRGEQGLLIAHRGASSLAPENTLAAAHKALAVGADMWEMDVALTRDGLPILIHDDHLLRTSNAAGLPNRQPWPVHQFTFEEIRRLDFGAWFNRTDPFGQIAAGHLSPEELDGYVGEAAPTLRQALLFTRENGWRVNVEIKDLSGLPGEARVVETVAALIKELAMVERVLISSFNHSYLRRVKIANPRLATGALVSAAHPDPAALLHDLEAQAFHPQAANIQPEAIATLREQGFEVNVWTVNDPALGRALIRAGASGIFTDFPQSFKI